VRARPSFVDLRGKVTSVCDAIVPGTSAQRAGDTVAFVSGGSAGFDVHVRNLATSTEIVFPAAPSARGIWLSPDGGKVLSFIAESTDPDSPVTLLEAPLSGGLGPRLEPKGGFGKAAFFEWDPGRMGLHSVIANADGSGDWLRLPDGADCLEWRGHTALCFNGSHLYAVRGEQAGLLAGGMTPEGVKGYLVADGAEKVFYVGAPGLFSVGVPAP